jgi:hypothetical protein
MVYKVILDVVETADAVAARQRLGATEDPLLVRSTYYSERDYESSSADALDADAA